MRLCGALERLPAFEIGTKTPFSQDSPSSDHPFQGVTSGPRSQGHFLAIDRLSVVSFLCTWPNDHLLLFLPWLLLKTYFLSLHYYSDAFGGGGKN